MARQVLQGRAGSSGIGVGRLLRFTSHGMATGAGPVPPVDRDREKERLRGALAQAAAELESLANATRVRAGEETAAIFEAQALFMKDPSLVDPAIAYADQGIPASAAIQRSAAEQAEILAALDDEYFRARAADIRDVGKRVAAILEGRSLDIQT